MEIYTLAKEDRKIYKLGETAPGSCWKYQQFFRKLGNFCVSRNKDNNCIFLDNLGKVVLRMQLNSSKPFVEKRQLFIKDNQWLNNIIYH